MEAENKEEIKMREIKFRAWDIEMKQMIDWDEIQEQWENEGYHSAILSADHYIPMQFTGLKDKNGKEIYKGDVVSWGDGWNNYKSSIVFENGAFRESRFKNTLEEICHYWDNGKYIECEVIGNIYENPELLKKG